jgi:hypothetical protein
VGRVGEQVGQEEMETVVLLVLIVLHLHLEVLVEVIAYLEPLGLTHVVDLELVMVANITVLQQVVEQQ